LQCGGVHIYYLFIIIIILFGLDDQNDLGTNMRQHHTNRTSWIVKRHYDRIAVNVFSQQR